MARLYWTKHRRSTRGQIACNAAVENFLANMQLEARLEERRVEIERARRNRALKRAKREREIQRLKRVWAKVRGRGPHAASWGVRPRLTLD